MKKYVLDMSGFSNPFEAMPEDIYGSLWAKLRERVVGGIFATTTEVYDELCHIPGHLGQCIKDHEAQLKLEVGSGDWDFATYTQHWNTLHEKYEPWVKGLNGQKASLSVPDLSVITLARTLALPVVSMEIPCAKDPKARKRKIPDVCALENIVHMTFNDLLRAEAITS